MAKKKRADYKVPYQPPKHMLGQHKFEFEATYPFEDCEERLRMWPSIYSNARLEIGKTVYHDDIFYFTVRANRLRLNDTLTGQVRGYANGKVVVSGMVGNELPYTFVIALLLLLITISLAAVFWPPMACTVLIPLMSYLFFSLVDDTTPMQDTLRCLLARECPDTMSKT